MEQKEQNQNEFYLILSGEPLPIFVENEAEKGIQRIAEISAEDIEAVCGKQPEFLKDISTVTRSFILYATLNYSPMLEDLINRDLLSVTELVGKRETYLIKLIENPWPGVSKVFVVCGSDKRGTIYGIFHISELLHVSPFIYWGDVKPEHRTNVSVPTSFEYISREPSVEYRGFFINDEWPCFGTWATRQFQGFTVQLYEKVFELLLRLKGNYLWPAMWSSSFSLDGPGFANAQLAELYGVIIGTSHHEPCLRASEEWDLCRGPKTCYGNEWNYVTNKEGLLNYWTDGLKRSAHLETVITVGMRGERDSSMLGPEASLSENIELLKAIITEQKKLIKTYINSDLTQVPMLLAAYKEVERYYHGTEDTKGLKDWDGLDNITILYCEDNYGNLRTLPEDSLRTHLGGYGMYYHLDYHGGPVSYEWVASTPLIQIWDQMRTAYEYGIQKLWIVNVGDLKFQEYPLAFFMNLAYDYQTWGADCQPSCNKFTTEFLNQQFGSRITLEELDKLKELLNGYLELNSIRRPEALHSKVYHPCHYRETDRMLQKADRLEELLNDLMKQLTKKARTIFESMLYYPAAASINLLKMHLFAGKNQHYASQGKLIANWYADKVEQCIRKDEMLAEEFSVILDGKWSGMELAPHIGFTTWNENGCRYPLRTYVEPVKHPRLSISRCDQEEVYTKIYGGPTILKIDDFMNPGIQTVELELANDGMGMLSFEILAEECNWLKIWPKNGKLNGSQPEFSQQLLTLSLNSDKLTKDLEETRVQIRGGDTVIELHVIACLHNFEQVPENTFYPNQGIITINAEHYSKKKDTKEAAFLLLKPYGKSGSGMKVFPVNKIFSEEIEHPILTYHFFLKTEGLYFLEIWTAPANPPYPETGIRFGITVNQEAFHIIDTIPDHFLAGEPGNLFWSKGVLENIRKTTISIKGASGLNQIQIHALDPGFVLERLLIYPDGVTPKDSYLGPEESYRFFSEKNS